MTGKQQTTASKSASLEGSLLKGRVQLPKEKEIPVNGYYFVELTPTVRAKLCLTHLADKQQWKEFGAQGLKQKFIRCRVLRRGQDSQLYVSLRESLVEDSPELPGRLAKELTEATALPSIGDRVKGYVIRTTKYGVFVRLHRTLTALVEKRYLSKTFITDLKHAFRPGQLVSGKVVRREADKGRVYLSLMESSQLPSSPVSSTGRTSKYTWETVQVGMKLAGTISSRKDYGVFVEIDDSDKLHGLCHKSELFDDGKGSGGPELFSIGDAVLVKVIGVDKELGRISLGMKPSYFTAEDIKDASGDVATEPVEQDELSDVDSPAVMEQEVEKKVKKKKKKKKKDEEVNVADPVVESVQDLQQQEGDATSVPSLKRKVPVAEAALAPSKASKRLLLSKRNPLLDDEALKDIELELTVSPTNSLLWISYISALASKNELSLAKEACERAIALCRNKNEGEVMNLWTAYLRLLKTYASETEFQGAFAKLLASTSPKEAHCLVSDIYKDHHRFGEADESLRKASKSMQHASRSCWLRRISLRFDQSEQVNSVNPVSKARASLFPEALRQLPPSKVPRFIMDVARLEYNPEGKYSSCARARTLFENLLSTHPQRADIWQQYIEAEIKHVVGPSSTDSNRSSNRNYVRRIFDRLLTVKLSTRAMRNLFKKWLQFEKEYGTPEEEESVREKARRYVEQIAS